MFVLKGAPEFTASFGNGRIKAKSTIRYLLGVQLDADMGYSSHISLIIKNSADLFSRMRLVVKSKWNMPLWSAGSYIFPMKHTQQMSGIEKP